MPDYSPTKQNENLTLPLLITRGLIVFPNASEEIDATRSFSVKAIQDAQEQTNSLLFLVSQRNSKIDEPKESDLYEVGTLCRIVSYSQNGNALRVRVVGMKRARFLKVSLGESPVAEGLLLETVHGDKAEEQGKLKELLESLSSNPELAKGMSRNALGQLSKSMQIEDVPDAIANYLPLTNDQKAELLSEASLLKRMDKMLSFLSSFRQMADVDKKISEKVQASAEKSQKDYYLREKMKAIKEELGEGGGEQDEASIKEKLEKNPYPENVKSRIKHELHRYEMMPESSLEASLIMSYIETLMNVPWFEKSEDNENLDNVRKVLDEDHYGLEKVKKRIIEYLAVKKMTGNLKAPILCFYGPPGCGKTSLGRSIARALGRKFFKASLGGISDEAEIRGHRRTYVGSMPGRIIQGMTKAGTCNPVFLLDEIDKVGGSNYRGDPSSALLEVLDPEQNYAFNDNYLEEPYDLSNVLFICTANNLDNIPRPLLDRLELIEVPSYTELEKIKIAEGFLIPKQTKANGLSDQDIHFDEPAIVEMIRHYSMEAGVRQLERLTASCCRKAVVELLDRPDTPKPIEVNPEIVKKYLGVEIFDDTKKEKENQVGVVTGLAYTEAGGDILPMEVTYFSGKGGLVLTGKLGEVMKESCQIALDYVRANAGRYHIDPKLFQENDIHVHFPEGAVPKDGPSAGVAITTAIISALTDTKVNANVAMTGEVTLRGRALPIGGLREKSLAAMRSGIKTILVPEANRKDVSELPKEVKEGLKIIFMKEVDDALKVALVTDEGKAS